VCGNITVRQKGYHPGEVGVVLRSFESTSPAGWREFEALAQAEVPSTIENVCVELTAGTDQDPLMSLGRSIPNIVFARELMTAAE